MSSVIHITSRAVIINEDHILMSYDPRPQPEHYYEVGKAFYYLPGGHVDFQESAKHALLREIKEETGFEGIIERFLGVFEHAWHPKEGIEYCHSHEINLIFKAQIPELNFNHLPNQIENHVAFEWVTLSNFQTLNFLPEGLKTLIPHWLKMDLDNSFKGSFF